MKFKKNLLVTFLLFISSFSFSQTLDEILKSSKWVMDYAEIISPSVENILSDSLYHFEQTTSNQIIILTLPQIPDGEEEFSFSMKVAEGKRIGQAKKDNGVFVLVTTRGDRKFKIYPGRGLEGAIPDILIDQFFRNVARPLLKSGNYDKAMLETYNFIASASRGEYKAEKKSSKNKIPNTAIFILILVFFIFYIFLSRIARKNKGMTTIGGRNHGIKNSSNDLFFIASILGSMGGGRSSGGGWGSGNGGGGFGGFSGGGGSFGGGGGGGSW